MQPITHPAHCARFTPTVLAFSLAAGLASLTAAPSMAADTTLPEVVVSATQSSPLSWAHWLGERDLAARRAATNDTASLLLGIPGVSINAAGGVSGLPQVNGLADDRLNIQLDGMGLIASCPNHMNPVLSYASPSQVSEITVYPGVAPVSVGGDAIGGAIEVKTAPQQFAAPGKTVAGGQVSSGYRSNGNARDLGLSAHYGTESFAIRYDGSLAKAGDYTASGDFKTTTETGRQGVTLDRNVVGSTAYDVRNHILGMAWRGSGQLIDLTLGYQDVPVQLYPNQRMDMLGNTEKRINLHWQRSFAWGGLDARIYHETVDHHMDFGADKRFWYGAASGGSAVPYGVPCSPISATCAAGMPMDTESRTTGAKVKATVDLTSTDTLRFGTDVQRYRLEDRWSPSGSGMWPGTFLNIHDGQRDRLGLWGEWQKQFTPQWQLLSGVRVEQVRTDAGPVTGYADINGMSFQARDASAFNASARESTDHNVDLSLLGKYRASNSLDVDLGLGRSTRSP
ncbi:MAG: TonB-dependent receptor, partial [Thiomonas sp.]